MFATIFLYLWRTHVYNNSESMGSQWVLFVATEATGPQNTLAIISEIFRDAGVISSKPKLNWNW